MQPSPPPPMVQVERGGHAYDVGLPRPRSALLPRRSPPARSARLAAEAGSARAVVLRFLIVTPDPEVPSHSAALAAFRRIGVPHEVLVARDQELTEELLYQPDGACRFAGVVLADGTLTYEDGGQWVSAFSQGEWDLLAAFEAECAAREAVWYGYPDVEYGLVETGTFEAGDHLAAGLTAGGAARFGYLAQGAVIPIDSVYGFRSAVGDPASTVPLVETAEGDVLAAVHARPDGTEVLVVTVDSAAWSLHSQLLEYGIIDWLARGLFVGERRIYLSPQVDDIFLASALWTDGGTAPIYRMTADDVAHLVAWQAELADRLPRGSSVVTQLPFNGLGAQPSEYPDPSLRESLLAVQDRFEWLNHTYTHDNMNEMGDSTAEVEVSKNCALADEWQLDRFHCTELVTPEISGLDNPDALAGMVAAGVETVVSDASLTEALNPDNPGSNPSPNVGRANPFEPRIFQVPRHPTNIFFSASLPAEEVGLYNELYAEEIGRELTYEEILDSEAAIGLARLLAYDVDPTMFHQANLRVFGGTPSHTLYTDWVDRVVERYTALMALPVIGLDLRRVARVMQEREALDRCGLTATLSADRSTLRLESTRACTVPVTGLDAPGAGDVERYGGVPMTRVQLSGCDEREVQLVP
ncbi:MAG TPA: hypothetical protein VFU21_17400 [Kofleriaceae bacterium]|nr:hypothetical protein [Kofleriaceae bacterium]